MDLDAKLSGLLDLADSLEIEIRRAAFGGQGGGMCVLKGRRVLFLDTDADLATQYDDVLRGFAQMPEIDSMFVRPDLRADLDRVKQGRSG